MWRSSSFCSLRSSIDDNHYTSNSPAEQPATCPSTKTQILCPIQQPTSPAESSPTASLTHVHEPASPSHMPTQVIQVVYPYYLFRLAHVADGSLLLKVYSLA
jgi:hypothetical protein